MSLRSSLTILTRILLFVSIVSTAYLYFYPVWSGCAFPGTTGSVSDGFQNTLAQHVPLKQTDYTRVAPFRLLVLADPQLEGDSSLPEPEDAFIAKLQSHWHDLRHTEVSKLPTTILQVLRNITVEDIPDALWAVRKTIDLFGNDYYLAHIYRTLHWWTNPTHVTVLGDLIGSQWVSDDEFAWRGWRYWNRVFAGSRPVEESYMSMHTKEQDEQHNEVLNPQKSNWSRQIINIAGNHDIGYAGDISELRTSRFQRAFGELNWDIRFEYPSNLIPENYTDEPVPSIHLVVLNSMLLDVPALNATLQKETYEYLNDMIQHRLSPVESPYRNTSFTLLLTHVPLHKPSGVCVDAPFFDFWDYTDEVDDQFVEGGVKEQNHLSQHVSENGILQSLFGMSGNLDAILGGIGRRGLILDGHDHEGCDVVHYVERFNVTPEVETEAGVNGEETLEAAPDGPWSDQDFMLAEVISPIDVSTNVEQRSEAGTEMLNSQPETTSSHVASEPSDSPMISSSSSPSTAASMKPSSPIPTWQWKSVRTSQYPPNESNEHETRADLSIALREVTLRSMMGSYGGNAGLLSVWFDFSRGIWEYEITMCKAGVQHIWWAIHILDLITIGVLLLWVIERSYTPKQKLVTKRIRAISYVRERPKKTSGVNGNIGDQRIVRQAKGVEDIKRAEGVQVGRKSQEGEAEKRRVYKHVLK